MNGVPIRGKEWIKEKKQISVKIRISRVLFL